MINISANVKQISQTQKTPHHILMKGIKIYLGEIAALISAATYAPAMQ